MRRRPSRALPAAAPPARPGGRRIGLLGGSFNPAHEGHRHVSLLALKRLGLHEVWWLVSPQNPLKSRDGMASFDERLAAAQRVAGDRRLRVTDIERRLRCRYSVDTVAHLRRRFPRHRLVWIMGADNLTTLADWRRWPALLRALPVAIVDRWPYSRYAGAVKPAKRFARWRLAERRAGGLVQCKPPAWVVIHGPLHPASATKLRATGRHRQAWGNAITSCNRSPGPDRGRSGTDGAEALYRIVAGALADAKAEDVVTIDLEGKTAIADLMVIATGRSKRHVEAVADRLLRQLKDAGTPARAAEGRDNCDWVLIDAGDVIVHVFRPEIRALYNLEKMWSVESVGAADEHHDGD